MKLEYIWIPCLGKKSFSSSLIHVFLCYLLDTSQSLYIPFAYICLHISVLISFSFYVCYAALFFVVVILFYSNKLNISQFGWITIYYTTYSTRSTGYCCILHAKKSESQMFSYEIVLEWLVCCTGLSE